MSLVRRIIGDTTYHEKRRDKRNSAPPLAITIDEPTYMSKDWSLGGILLSGYRGERVEGEEINGNLRLLNTSEKQNFKGSDVRQDAAKGELALKFTGLSDAAFTLLENASTGRVHRDWAFR